MSKTTKEDDIEWPSKWHELSVVASARGSLCSYIDEVANWPNNYSKAEREINFDFIVEFVVEDYEFDCASEYIGVIIFENEAEIIKKLHHSLDIDWDKRLQDESIIDFSPKSQELAKLAMIEIKKNGIPIFNGKSRY